MKASELIEGNYDREAYIDGGRDLAMDGELKPLIRNKATVTLVRATKKGLIQVKDSDGKLYSVPPNNINLI